jgi:hypothetical protein
MRYHRNRTPECLKEAKEAPLFTFKNSLREWLARSKAEQGRESPKPQSLASQDLAPPVASTNR